MSFDFDIGSFRGQPNYLMRSKKGLYWDNLPPSLVALVTLDGMADAVVSYALGPNGLYWLQYSGEGDEVVTEAAPGLWGFLGCDANTGLMINRLEFGQARTFWGTYSWVGEDHQVNQSIHYNNLPEGLVNQIAELDNQGLLCDYSDIGFLAMGKDNSWILECKGWIWSDGIDHALFAAIQEVKEGVNAVNVTLSPLRIDCWWVEYSDGSTHFQVPAHWNTPIAEYGSLQYALKKQPRSMASVGRSVGLGLKKAGPAVVMAGAVGCALM